MPNTELTALMKLNEKANRLAADYADVKTEIRAKVLGLHGTGVFARDIAAAIGVEPQTVRAWWSEARQYGLLTTADTQA